MICCCCSMRISAAPRVKPPHLLTPLIAGEADLTHRALSSAHPATAGFGLVKGLARLGTWLLIRQWLTSPLPASARPDAGF